MSYVGRDKGIFKDQKETDIDAQYPNTLKLVLVQSIFRHGERAPVRARLANAGIPQHFNLCHHVGKFDAAVRVSAAAGEPLWGRLRYRRIVEEMGEDGKPELGSDTQGICLLGELTDKGRRTTFQLGQRLRALYVERLKFADELHEDELYMRSSPMPRALESLQQVFSGLFPREASPHSSFNPVFRQRNFTEENLFPNEVYRTLYQTRGG